ncbi:MAG: YihY/virulence factor BrkB family protein [Desulfobacterales bacterium]
MVKTIYDVTVQSVKQWWRDDVFLYAAAIAFYTIFSLAPILLISAGIASLVFSEQQAEDQIVKELENLTGSEGAKVARQVLQNVNLLKGSPMAVVIGLLTALIGSTAVFANLQSSLNHIWRVRSKKDLSMIKVLIRVRMRSFGIVLAVGFLLLVSMVFSALLNGVQTLMADQMKQISWVWQLMNTLISIGVITLLFAMIYKYLPDVKIAWQDVIIGAALTSVLFTIGKTLIGLYLGQVAIGSTYGAAGSFVVLLIWIYYSSLIFFFGAEFTHVYAHRFGRRIRPEKHAEKMEDDLAPG